MPPYRPTAVVVIAILHFVFGGLGIIGGLCTGGSQALRSFGVSGSLQGQNGAADYETVIEQKAPSYRIVKPASVAGDLLISVLMIVSGFGLLEMRPWGQTLSILYAVLSILLKIGSSIYAFVVMVPIADELFNTVFKQQMPAGGPPPPPGMADFFGVMGKVAAWAGVVWPLLTMIYPIIVLIIMLRPSVAAAFAGRRAAPEDHDDYDRGGDPPLVEEV